MTLPSILLGFCVATLFGAAFHLWKDGGFWRLLLDLLLSWIGFFAGHFVAQQIGWGFLSIGPLHLGMAILCCILLLLVGHWLTSMRTEKKA